MNLIKTTVQSVLEWFKNPIPPEYQEIYRLHSMTQNIKVLRWILLLLLAWALAMVISDVQAMSRLSHIPHYSTFIWIDSGSLILGVLLLVIYGRLFAPGRAPSENRHHRFVYFCVLIILCLGALISGIEFEATRGAPSYIITVFLIATVFELPEMQIISAFLLSTLVVILTVAYLSQDVTGYILKNMGLFILVFFGWFTVHTLSLTRRHLFLERKRLAESNVALEREIEQRRNAQKSLQKAHDELEARVQERTETLNQQNSALEQTVREKNVLLQEVYHRVKNNLQIIISLLNLHSKSIKDSRLKDIFRDSQNRIRSMALIHEKLYRSKSLSKIDLKYYISDLAATLFRSFGIHDREIQLEVDGDSVELPLKIAVPCGLAVNELMSNTIKYAFPETFTGEKKMSIRLRIPDRNQLELHIADNGVGIQNSTSGPSEASIGRELIEILVVEQLNEHLNIRAVLEQFADSGYQ